MVDPLRPSSPVRGSRWRMGRQTYQYISRTREQPRCWPPGTRTAPPRRRCTPPRRRPPPPLPAQQSPNPSPPSPSPRSPSPNAHPSLPPLLNPVAIRFQRFGRKKSPFYRLVAIDSRVRRDGRPLEYLGWYDPLKKETNLNAPAIKQWLSVGAQPSDTVRNLLKKAYVIQPDNIKVQVPKVEL